MSSSYSAEMELRQVADELHAKAYELEKAADVLQVLREDPDLMQRVESAKKWAREWMK